MLNLNLWRPKPGSGPAGNPPAAAIPAAATVRSLLRIVVLNSKGGCGKTTLSTNLAGYYACCGYRTALLDTDPQGSSMLWLRNRAAHHPRVTGISAYERAGRVTRSFQLRVPPDIERLIVDTPAALDGMRLQELTRGADAILIPVLPSDIDIHAASRCIAELLLTAHIDRRAGQVAVIANRVKKNTLMYDKLLRFLQSLGIPFIATLRDTQNYVHASEQGVCIHELDARKIGEDVREWEELIRWLESRQTPAAATTAAPLTQPGNQPAG